MNGVQSEKTQELIKREKKRMSRVNMNGGYRTEMIGNGIGNYCLVGGMVVPVERALDIDLDGFYNRN